MIDDAVFALAELAAAALIVALLAVPIYSSARGVAQAATAYSVAAALNETARNGSVATIYTTVPVSLNRGRVGPYQAVVSGSLSGALCIHVVSGVAEPCGA